jgi:FkbM family methyltransferase
MGQLAAVVKQVTCTGPESSVPLRWIFRTGSRLDKRFAKSGKYVLDTYGEYTRIDYRGETFLWPRKSKTETLLMLVSELMTPDHPHQYLYGPTQLCPSDVVLDIGACEGAFSAYVTSKVKRVIAVEPSRSMCSTIETLFKLRKEPPPIILNCLLGNKNGSAHFAEREDNPAVGTMLDTPRRGSYEIPVRTMDELVDSLELKPTFIKCDAEGAEFAIFSNAANFLRNYRPRLAMTTYHTPTDYRNLHMLLTDFGYNVMGKGLLFAHDRLLVQMIHAW